MTIHDNNLGFFHNIVLPSVIEHHQLEKSPPGKRKKDLLTSCSFLPLSNRTGILYLFLLNPSLELFEFDISLYSQLAYLLFIYLLGIVLFIKLSSRNASSDPVNLKSHVIEMLAYYLSLMKSYSPELVNVTTD